MNTNEEKARHLVTLRQMRDHMTVTERDAIAAYNYALAALARQEEGREAVAWRVPTPYGVGYNFASETVMKDIADWLHPAPPSSGEGDALRGSSECPICANSSPHQHTGVEVAEYRVATTNAHKRIQQLPDVYADFRAWADQHMPHNPRGWETWLAAHDRYSATPTPQAGEGDAEVARLRQALQDVADPIGYLRREAEAKGERLGGMAYSIANDLHFVKQIASRALATPTPQSGEAAPIAWRFRYFDKATRIGFWRYSEGEPEPSHETGDLGFEKQPLYAAPASPQGVSDAVELLRHRLCNDEDAWRALLVVMNALNYGTAAGAAPEGWQPIETCPHGDVGPGEPNPDVLVVSRSGRICTESPRTVTRLREAAVADGEDCIYTHWQPLPAAPNPGAQHGQEGR